MPERPGGTRTHGPRRMHEPRRTHGPHRTHGPYPSPVHPAAGRPCTPADGAHGHPARLPAGRQDPTLTVKRRGFPSCAAPETSGSPSGRTSSYGNA